ncbi:MAG: polysaccharide deacetylase family protein [Patescibacteria group bacterium]|nr:polysaccharide deacetylase family protein [Patescibacteria group bacterium]
MIKDLVKNKVNKKSKKINTLKLNRSLKDKFSVDKFIKNNKKLFLFFIGFFLIFSIIVFSCLFLLRKQEQKVGQKRTPLASDLAPSSSPSASTSRLVKEATKEAVVAAPEKNNQKISRKLPIIMYHYVENILNSSDTLRQKLNIPPAIFENELKNLKENGYQTYFVREVPEIINDRMLFSPKGVILSFDDGYEDFYADVFPLLKRYQTKATLYVIYNFIDRPGYLSASQIRELIASGLVEIGSHTLDHIDLRNAPDSVAKREIFESKQRLENKFGIKVKTFAYPFGTYNSETLNLVKESGYTAAVSTIPGTYHSNEKLFYLHRLRPGIFYNHDMVKVLEEYKY